MNWLLGGGGNEVPETPVHRWAMNAFKGAIMPEGLYGNSQLLVDSPSTGNSGSSILKTPGQARDKRRVNVTFHKSVHTPPKRTSRSGLPSAFPGKFPSPWTPKLTTGQVDQEIGGENKLNDSPISIDKDRREHSRFANPLKVLSAKLEIASTASSVKSDRQPLLARKIPVEQKAVIQPPKDKDRIRPRALSWDVDRGFDEVLASISKNNAYLQSLIDEMQESCAFADESFNENPSMAEADLTTNIEEPVSTSGKYWRSKFLEFAELTKRVKTEQDNMEQALAQLRLDVHARTAEDQENWKDRYDLLKEELEKERKTARSSAQTRELRDLRRTVRDLQGKASEVTDLQKQLQIADMQIKDFQSQIQIKQTTTSSKAQSIPWQHEHSAPKQVLSSSPILADPVGAADLAPQSSTSRRLAQARSAAQGKVDSDFKSSVVHETARSVITETRSGFTQASKHRRFGSRTLNVPVHPDSENTKLAGLSKPQNDSLNDVKQSTKPDEPSKPATTSFSPRPKFVDLDVNSCDRPKANQAAQAVITCAPIMSEETIQKREAARRRLEQRKAEKMRMATKV